MGALVEVPSFGLARRVFFTATWVTHTCASYSWIYTHAMESLVSRLGYPSCKVMLSAGSSVRPGPPHGTHTLPHSC